MFVLSSPLPGGTAVGPEPWSSAPLPAQLSDALPGGVPSFKTWADFNCVCACAFDMECVCVAMIDRVLRPVHFGEPFRVQVARGCQEPPWAVGHSDELPISPCLGRPSTWAELALNIRSPARLPPLGCLQS